MDISPNISIFEVEHMKTLNHSQIEPLIWDIYHLSAAKLIAKSLSQEEKQKQSHFLEDILLTCKFNGQKCTLDDFEWTLDLSLGNCFTFNTANVSTNLKKTSIAGHDNGLLIDLYVNFHEDLTLFNAFS